uniref:hypothetical protein n=1 Tax=Streptococcus TaxID=1301 RepID=UPI001897ED1B
RIGKKCFKVHCQQTMDKVAFWKQLSISYFGEGIFYCLPRSKFVESHKEEIREKYNLSNEMPKINGIYLGTFIKMRAWDRIRKTKPSLKEIINMVEK